MLKVTIHSGNLADRNPGNQLARLDIAYAKQEAFADYALAFSLKGVGEVAPDQVSGYPRWAGSLWDLTARAMTRILYRADEAPCSGTPDRRCAYATRLCAVVEKSTRADRGIELATAEIAQLGNQRGTYTATFKEDILGPRTAQFSYGLKSLNPADLLLRAICWTYFSQDVLGPRPTLILPATLRIDGVDQFPVDALAEPARTGFQRYRGDNSLVKTPLAPLAKAEDYVKFLMKG